MTYLERLLARTGVLPATTPAAAPRLPSWFEPEVAGPDGQPQPEPVRADPVAVPALDPPQVPTAAAPSPVASPTDRPLPPTAPPVVDRAEPAPVTTTAAPPLRDAAPPQPARLPEPAVTARAQADPVPATPVPASPVPAPADPDRTAPRQPPAPDVVQVTIGRIEVRATIAPPRPAAPAPPPAPVRSTDRPDEQVLSLADYLHGKRGAR